MSDYKFKSFSEIDTVEAPSETTTVVGIENGKPIQMPMKSVKTGEPIVINYHESPTDDPVFGDKVKERLLNGVPVWVYYQISDSYGQIIGFKSAMPTDVGYVFHLIPSIRPLFSGSSICGTEINTDGYSFPVKVSTDEV